MLGFRSTCITSFHLQTLNLIHNFHKFLLISTSTSTSASTAALVSSSFFPKNNKVFGFESSDNANSVVHFLKQHGFKDSHITKTVSLYPAILTVNVNETLIPKFKLLQDHGFFGSNLIRAIALNPKFLITHLNPISSDLRIVMGTDENLVKLFIKCNSNITSRSLKNLISNVRLLENDYRVDIETVRSNVLQSARPFLRKTDRFRKSVHRVDEELGIPLDSKMFMYGIHLLCSLSEKSIKSRRQLFKSFGWTDFHISELLRRSPCTFLPSEETNRKRLDFFMNELGYDPDYLATHSALFTYSLKKRLMPRHRVLQVLKEKGLCDYKLYSASLKSEPCFLEMFVEPFLKDVPELLEIYQNS